MAGRAVGRRGLLAAVPAVALLPLLGCASAEASKPAAGKDPSGAGSVMIVPPADRRTTPAIKGPELGTDETIALSDYRGRIIVLNVWGSWCPPCRKEAPDLEVAWQRTKSRTQFLGINTRDTSQDQALAFVRTFGITYPHIYDPAGALMTRFHSYLPLSAIPSTLLVDAEFKIAARIIGTVTEDTLVDMIDEVDPR